MDGGNRPIDQLPRGSTRRISTVNGRYQVDRKAVFRAASPAGLLGRGEIGKSHVLTGCASGMSAAKEATSIAKVQIADCLLNNCSSTRPTTTRPPGRVGLLISGCTYCCRCRCNHGIDVQSDEHQYEQVLPLWTSDDKEKWWKSGSDGSVTGQGPSKSRSEEGSQRQGAVRQTCRSETTLWSPRPPVLDRRIADLRVRGVLSPMGQAQRYCNDRSRKMINPDWVPVADC